IISAPGEIVRGVLYEVTQQEMEEKDVAESVPQGLYVRETYLVLGEDRKWHSADLYRCAKPTGPLHSGEELRRTHARRSGGASTRSQLY
ncbi:MAG: hypothetical protein NTY03_11770, partial [Candidatus Bathyarchaeota archaeon]|nr:hypothetical protein [Candidatus Bathyarchaeota archaeon]